jgi:hypothetical protein
MKQCVGIIAQYSFQDQHKVGRTIEEYKEYALDPVFSTTHAPWLRAVKRGGASNELLHEFAFDINFLQFHPTVL